MLDENKKGFPESELESIGESKWLGHEEGKGWYRISEMASRERIYFGEFYSFLEDADGKLDRLLTKIEKELKKAKTPDEILRLAASLIVADFLKESVRRYYESADWLDVMAPRELLEEFEETIDDFVEEYYYVSLVHKAGSLSRSIIEEVLRI
jgi:predicted ribosome quality control (RQC) complex YloA/Tae2 family protein